jgi:hypothetical protein
LLRSAGVSSAMDIHGASAPAPGVKANGNLAVDP